MFVRVLVLFLGLLGGITSGLVGYRWLSGKWANAEAVEARRESSDEDVQKAVTQFDRLSRASWFLLAALPLGIAGGVLTGMGRGRIGGPLMLAAVPGPVIFALGNGGLTTSVLFLGGVLGLLAPRPRDRSEAGLRGCWNGIKTWLNIGGVKLRFLELNSPLRKAGSAVAGKLLVSSKSAKHVAEIHYRLVQIRTTGSGKKKKTEEFVLGESVEKVGLDLAAGQSRALEFRLPYSWQKSMKDMGSVLGGVGKALAFVEQQKDEYSLFAEAAVAGSLREPSASLDLKMAD
jgi:hypothetical protein